MYRKISDYGVIGNLSTVALVGLNGSIDWFCAPFLDSPSVFAAILDASRGGSFSISPAGDYDSIAEYIPDTNVLVTRFRTRSGIASLTDFMPVSRTGPGYDGSAPCMVCRKVEVEQGSVALEVVFNPRFDYGRAGSEVILAEGGVAARGAGEVMFLSSTVSFETDKTVATARLELQRGQVCWFCLRYGGEACAGLEEPAGAEESLEATVSFWRDWLYRNETGRKADLGPYAGMVHRSALALKLLQFRETGAIAAAATASLPEEIGGARNWDYRYTWIRDTAFTLQALFDLGHLSETEAYLRWITRVISKRGADEIQIMYGLRGEDKLDEQILPHLEGYRGSGPVRIGNGAAKQKQLDIYGELMEAALRLSDYVGKIDESIWPFFQDVCEYVAGVWQDRDSGIWEVRDGPHHFVYSKVMCWTALDRGIEMARRYGFPGDTDAWERTAETIRREVLARGWSEEKQAFVQHYDTGALDASVLLLPVHGFIRFDDPRMLSTVEAVMSELGSDGLLYRYVSEDGVPGREGAFLICTFWLIHNLIAVSRLDEAESLLRHVSSLANHVGLFSEEYDPGWREALGNFPQALTHIGFINSVIALQSARDAEKEKHVATVRAALPQAVPDDGILNAGKASGGKDAMDIATGLKDIMNRLRGAFFDRDRRRIAYERMAGSRLYADYVELARALRRMDPGVLGSDARKIAFWINIYNVMVIHGVVALGIKDSVREVRRFFQRIRYEIGGMLFTPDDVEHGILRGNRRPPGSLFRPFSPWDERRRHMMRILEPRIHFALVCASSSCPPIEVYTEDDIDRQLDVAAMTFLNGGGLEVDRKGGIVRLSRIFKWYMRDFGETVPDILRFVAGYLYNRKDAEFIEENASVLRVSYMGYDWRLNRA